MPAITSYSPYETLVFFQNVAHRGADKTSLQSISTALNQNQLIRESEDYDPLKFSPDALQHLYTRTINAHKDELPNGVNGNSTATNGNPLKRKLSTSPAPTPAYENDHFLQQFVDNLYAKFKEEAIKELRQGEEDYQKAQDDIQNLEDQIKAEDTNNAPKLNALDENVEPSRPSSAQSTGQSDPVSVQMRANLEAASHNVKPSVQSVQPQVLPQPPPQVVQSYEGAQQPPAQVQRHSTPKSSSGTPVPRHSQPPQLPLPSQHHSPGAFSRTLPPPSPQRNTYGPLPPPPHAFPPHAQNQPPPPMLPPIQSLQRMSSHEGYPQRAPTQGHGSPMPQHPQQGYSQYPQYPQPPPHGWHSPAPQPYPQPQYPGPQHYPPQPQGRYPQVHTPNQQPYQHYPHTAPVPYGNQPSQWRPPPVPQYHHYPASANTTPLPRSETRSVFLSSARSTPWKRRNLPPGLRYRSPTRLDREVSPISDDDSSSPKVPAEKSEKQGRREENTVKRSLAREKSATPAANISRSQSVMSNRSETPNPPKRKVGRPPKIKPEAPSTPAPTNSDSELQRSSGRRGRAPTTTINNKPEIPRPSTTIKRKRDAPSTSPVPRGRSMSNTQTPALPRNVTQNFDPNLVVVSKTFGRTSHLLLNEITSHKLAGIFAKPLSERDAPGYKSLIHRPQDLKSIKAAISKGSRAAITAIEKLESENGATETGDDEATPAPAAKITGPATVPTNGNSMGEGPIGNGFYRIRANEDLIPPKGIVNSAQLEMELVRMFANAVMFNPLPTSERGFGRSLRLRKRGGELTQYGARHSKPETTEDQSVAENEASEESEAATSANGTSETESSAASSDEVGIIADAREMFADVEKLVSRWRELEGGGSMSIGWQGSFTSVASVPSVSAGIGIGSSVTERHASVSASSVAGEDEGDGTGIGTPSASLVGSVRKRRKIGDR